MKKDFEKRVYSLLRKIEWSGPSDYSIGVSTCPCCKRRTDRIRGWKAQGHTKDCELAMLLKETK